MGLLLKGKLHPQRSLTIQFGERNLHFVQCVWYHGVTLQAQMKLDAHVHNITEKATNLFYTLARLGVDGWGYQVVNYRILYKVLFQINMCLCGTQVGS